MRRGRFIALLVLLMPSAAAADPVVVAQTDDAYVAHDAGADSWTIGTSGLTFSLSLSSGTLRAVDLRAPRLTTPFAIATSPDTVIVINGRDITLEADEFDSFRATPMPDGVSLDLVFTIPLYSLRITRSYAMYRHTPIVEAWTTVESMSGTATLQGLNAWQLTVPVGTVRTVTGLKGDDADNTDPNVAAQFTIERRDVEAGRRLDFGAAGRSSEQTVPWFAIERSDAVFFGGLMWSGSWTLAIERTGSAMRTTLGLGSTTTTVTSDRAVETPHGFFGLTPGTAVDVSRAMADFVASGAVRAGRPLRPLVTYNTWFAYGTRVDEAQMLEAIDAASRLGAELFVLDAGWYTGAGRDGLGDFTSGLGAYDSDPGRFPSGLRALADHAEALGMQFGIWVEPERTAIENVGRGGLDERWLATRDGRYIPGVAQNRATAAQICLADARARQWLLEQLVRLIDEVRPAYLKWDNNFWINCTRSGHGHGASDGNFAHVAGLYQLLGELRARYPELSIENVSGGGNRLDFGMARFTDTAWVDDRTAPSAIVRHNLQGLYELFPPAYLLAFTLDGPGEPMYDAPDLALYLRSRMAGVLGLTVLPGQLDEADEAMVASEVGLYKELAERLGRSAGVLLTAQTTAGQPGWDAVQSVTDGGNAIIFAYQHDPGVSRVTLKPQGLRRRRNYEVVSADAGPIGTATGETLMRDGIEILASPVSAGHILFLQRTSPATPP
jgi:alpha-galactosidase